MPWIHPPPIGRLIAAAMACCLLLPGAAFGAAVEDGPRNPASADPTPTANGAASHPVPVFRSGEEGYHTYRIPALIETRTGKVLAFAEGRKRGKGDAGDIDTVLKVSRDQGSTWGPLQKVWDDGPNTCGNPCVVQDASTGTLWLLQTWNLGTDPEPRIIAGTSADTRRVFVLKSGDDGLTWSAPREITTQVKRTNWTWYATGPGAGIQLRQGQHAGRLVIPCDHIEAGTRRYFSHVIFSDDHGETWKLGGTTPRDEVNECEVVELADGSLRLNMRSYDPSRRARQTAISRDGGASWEDQRLVPALPDPICQATIRRWSWPSAGVPGVVLFANAASTNRRERLTLRASLDEGESWSHSRVVEPGPSAYSSLAVFHDGSIGLLHESAREALYDQITFRRLSLEWLGISPASVSPSQPGPRLPTPPTEHP